MIIEFVFSNGIMVPQPVLPPALCLSVTRQVILLDCRFLPCCVPGSNRTNESWVETSKAMSRSKVFPLEVEYLSCCYEK